MKLKSEHRQLEPESMLFNMKLCCLHLNVYIKEMIKYKIGKEKDRKEKYFHTPNSLPKYPNFTTQIVTMYINF